MLWKFFLGVVVGFFIVVPVAHAQEFFAKDLKYGAKGDAVIELQEFLTEEKLYSGPISGSFYSLTRVAVRKFQKREKIKQTGQWDNKTRERANQILTVRLEDEGGEVEEEAPKLVWPWLQQPAAPRVMSTPVATSPTTQQPVEQPSKIPSFLKPFVQPIVDLFTPTPTTTSAAPTTPPSILPAVPVTLPLLPVTSPITSTPSAPVTIPASASSTPTTPTFVCGDTDGGYDLFKKGTTVSRDSSGRREFASLLVSETDQCSMQNEAGVYLGVAEKYCDGNIVQSKDGACPSGYYCKDGACAAPCSSTVYNIDLSRECNTTKCPYGCKVDSNSCPSACLPLVCPNNGFNTGSGSKSCNWTACPVDCETDANGCPSACRTCPANNYSTGDGNRDCNYTRCPSGCGRDAYKCPSGCKKVCPYNIFNKDGGASFQCDTTLCPDGCTTDANGCPSGCNKLICPDNGFNVGNGYKGCNSVACNYGCETDANGCPSGCKSLCPGNTYVTGYAYDCNTTVCPNGCVRGNAPTSYCPTGCKTVAAATEGVKQQKHTTRTFFRILSLPFLQVIKALGF